MTFDYKECLKILNIELTSDIDYKNYENYENYEYKYINYSISGINRIDYYLYTPEGLLNPLNLSECMNKTKKISYLDSYIGDKKELLLQFLKDGDDIFNGSSPSHNNYCYSFSFLNEFDLTLYERKSYLLKEYGYICGDCEYQGINANNYEVSCLCENETNINNKIKEEEIISQLKNIKKYENFRILECYKLAISKEGQNNNYFSEILMIYISINTIFLFQIVITNNIINNNINEKEKRNFFQMFWLMFKSDYDFINNFVNSLIYIREGQIYSIKLMIYFKSLIISLVSTIFFYTDDTMHKIYINNGKYKIINQLPNILFSYSLSSIFSIIFGKLVFIPNEVKDKDNIQKFKNKCIYFFTISFLLELFSWYYVSCFFAVYQNTKKYVLKDFLLGRLLNLIIYIIKSLLITLREKYNKNIILKLCQCIKYIKNKTLIITIDILLMIILIIIKYLLYLNNF